MVQYISGGATASFGQNKLATNLAIIILVVLIVWIFGNNPAPSSDDWQLPLAKGFAAVNAFAALFIPMILPLMVGIFGGRDKVIVGSLGGIWVTIHLLTGVGLSVWAFTEPLPVEPDSASRVFAGVAMLLQLVIYMFN